MMLAIETKTLRSGKIKASCQLGSKTFPRTEEISLASDHVWAARDLADQHGWTKNCHMIPGMIKPGHAVHVFTPKGT